MPQQVKESEKKARRRGNNEGSIYQRKDGRWCAQVTIGYRDDGKSIMKYAYGNSRKEAAKKLTKMTSNVFENGYSSVTMKDTKQFNLLLEDWFVTFKEPNIQSVTVARHRNYMKNHIGPAFEGIEVQQVDLFRLQRFFNTLSKKGLCLDTIKKMRQMLNQFYVQYVIKLGLVKENPLEGVQIKSVQRKDPDDEDNLALSPELRVQILDNLKTETVLKPILTTFMLTGMRPGELIALRWRDVDFKKSTISVRYAINREVDFDENGEVIGRREVVGNTKTALSVRSFMASESAMQCLEDWKEYQKAKQQETGIEFTSGNCYVFSTKTGTIRSYGGLRTMLVRFLAKYGMEDHGISLYTFRHTFATMLLEERENPKIVSKLMGHSKVLTTLSIYSHVISNSVYEQTAKTLDSAYRNLIADKEKTDEPLESSSVLGHPKDNRLPLKTDSNADSNADNFRQF